MDEQDIHDKDFSSVFFNILSISKAYGRMLKKVVITVNFFLVLLWSYSLIDLWRQISRFDNRGGAERGVQWSGSQKSTYTWDADARNMFDTKAVEVKKAKAEEVETNPADALNEKGLADVTLRVMGIFTSRNQRFAVFDKVSKKTSKKETVKVVPGAVIAGYTVKKILPDVVTLVEPSTGETVVLKIFKPLQEYPPISSSEGGPG